MSHVTDCHVVADNHILISALWLKTYVLSKRTNTEKSSLIFNFNRRGPSIDILHSRGTKEDEACEVSHTVPDTTYQHALHCLTCVNLDSTFIARLKRPARSKHVATRARSTISCRVAARVSSAVNSAICSRCFSRRSPKTSSEKWALTRSRAARPQVQAARARAALPPPQMQQQSFPRWAHTATRSRHSRCSRMARRGRLPPRGGRRPSPLTARSQNARTTACTLQPADAEERRRSSSLTLRRSSTSSDNPFCSIRIESSLWYSTFSRSRGS